MARNENKKKIRQLIFKYFSLLVVAEYWWVFNLSQFSTGFPFLDSTRPYLIDFENWIIYTDKIKSVEIWMGTHLHACSPTSLKKTHVPPFKQNAFPITGHGDPECVQLWGVDGKWPAAGKKIKQKEQNCQ